MTTEAIEWSDADALYVLISIYPPQVANYLYYNLSLFR